MKVTANVYATATGFKVGSKGKVIPMEVYIRSLPKGERRKIRKACERAGLAKHARS